ncbi:MAG: prepilin-type N-terminal cleavage/methylation domain-containing protein [Lachnospiraceae bacterium]|nr:prepilin-type N-terminal cleavage/methylation domain-containing protein [Lachnospiraceae bacterium]
MKERKQNKGFTLVELIIALAVLAFLMTAVSSFMGSSVLNNRKAKADIKVTTDSQLVYNQIQDCFMQARNVVIIGREYSTADQFDFEKRDSGAGVTPPDRILYVKDDAAADKVKKNLDFYGLDELSDNVNAMSIKYFKDMAATDYIYVDELIIETAVPLNMDDVPSGVSGVAGTWGFSSPLAGEGNIQVKGTKSDIDATKIVYDKDDTCVHRFSFNGKYLYYGKRYYIMTLIDDVLDTTVDANKEQHIYSGEMGYVECQGGTTISGCVLSIKPDVSQVKIDMYFTSDFKNESVNMSYDTKDKGMVNIRNSHILMDK